MATVFIPALMRDLTGGQETVVVAGASVGDIVHVDFNPRWHKVKRIQLATPAPKPR